MLQFLSELFSRFWHGEVDIGKCCLCGTRFNFDDYETEDDCIEALIEHGCSGVFALNYRRFFGLYKDRLELRLDKKEW